MCSRDVERHDGYRWEGLMIANKLQIDEIPYLYSLILLGYCGNGDSVMVSYRWVN